MDITKDFICRLLFAAADEDFPLIFCGGTGRGMRSFGRGKRSKCESLLTCP